MKNAPFQWLLVLCVMWMIGMSASFAAQNDTVKVQHTGVTPVIDGVGNDACWDASGVTWQSMDQVWMPWLGTVPSSSDFTGKYKVIWNESENVLYFLFDIVDDVFVDGYDFIANGPYGYPNYDIVEIFLDENRSKGGHVFDSGSENAQNAFSYHVTVTAPADGETTGEFTVEDLDGSSWSNFRVVNYAGHFPDLKMKKSGNNYVYEFSLKVYNDSYPTQQKDGSTPSDIENARVKLQAGKIMGASMAYCDNDINDGKRDHFFGSTPGKEYTANFGFSGTQNSINTENGQKIFNTNWMSANDYGVFELMGTGATNNNTIIGKTKKVVISQNGTNNDLNLSITSATPGKIVIEVYNFSGQKITEFMDVIGTADYQNSFSIETLKTGIYIARLSMGEDVYVRKIVKK